MSQELKKCPCCKGPAIYNEDLNRFYAECHHCQLRTASYRTKDRAAEIWNTRQDEWISVEDRLPEGKADVLIAYSYEPDEKPCTAIAFLECGIWYAESNNLMIDSKAVTHWKPITLPEVE